MKAKIEGGKLILEIPIKETVSKSGKSLVIASTNGNILFPGLEHNGKPVTVGVNAYISNK